MILLRTRFKESFTDQQLDMIKAVRDCIANEGPEYMPNYGLDPYPITPDGLSSVHIVTLVLRPMASSRPGPGIFSVSISRFDADDHVNSATLPMILESMIGYYEMHLKRLERPVPERRF